jgi:AcrR family transcriptional regulator
MTEPRVRRSREEQREETRRRLLEAARQTFVRRGYEASSVEEIAELAGYTRAAASTASTTPRAGSTRCAISS